MNTYVHTYIIYTCYMYIHILRLYVCMYCSANREYMMHLGQRYSSCLYMHIYTYIYKSIYIHIHIYKYMYIHICIYSYVYI